MKNGPRVNRISWLDDMIYRSNVWKVTAMFPNGIKEL